MVFQNFGLMPWRTIQEKVLFGIELARRVGPQHVAHAAAMIELVGLQKWADKRPHELSGGMQQRVGLARAFAHPGDILLMDEPFSALDPLIRRELRQELKSIRNRLGRTIVFVTHDWQEAVDIGDRIAIMDGGKLVQVGTPADIRAQPVSEIVRRFTTNC